MAVMNYIEWIEQNEDYWDISRYTIIRIHVKKRIDLSRWI